LGEHSGQQTRRLYAGVDEPPLLRGVPAAGADALAREVHDGVEPIERTGVELVTIRMPLDDVFAGLRAPAHDADDTIAPFLKKTAQGGADESAGTGNCNFHRVPLPSWLVIRNVEPRPRIPGVDTDSGLLPLGRVPLGR
jgi:hypothetical protein